MNDITDTERLFWLAVGDGAKKAARVIGTHERNWSVLDCSNGLVFMSRGAPTWRDAIDIAMGLRKAPDEATKQGDS